MGKNVSFFPRIIATQLLDHARRERGKEGLRRYFTVVYASLSRSHSLEHGAIGRPDIGGADVCNWYFMQLHFESTYDFPVEVIIIF